MRLRSFICCLLFQILKSDINFAVAMKRTRGTNTLQRSLTKTTTLPKRSKLHSTSNNYHDIDRLVKKFLVKSEPDELPIEIFDTYPNQIGRWDGVRNAQARNIMREMEVGDLCFFYHAKSKKATGIVGIVEVVKSSYPDEMAFDPSSKYYDSKSSRDNPKWLAVDIKLREKWEKPILLTELKEEFNKQDSSLQHMMLFKVDSLKH